MPGVQDHDMGGIFGQERSMVLFDGARKSRGQVLEYGGGGPHIIGKSVKKSTDRKYKIV